MLDNSENLGYAVSFLKMLKTYSKLWVFLDATDYKEVELNVKEPQ